MLTDAKLKSLKPKPGGKPFKVTDANGLYVHVGKGRPSFRLDYRLGGKRKTLTFGRYPAVTLHEARRRREAAEALLADGRDPGAEKQARKRATALPVDKPTFKEAALRWHGAQEHRWTRAYGRQVLARLESDVLPEIGSKRFPIDRGDILACLRKVEARGVRETTRRLRQYVGCIIRFAGAEDSSIVDETPMLKGALQALPAQRHHAKIAPSDIGTFLRRLDSSDCEDLTRRAIRFTIFTAARTGEIIGAQWPEFEHLDSPAKAIWRIPAERMKMKSEHLVPLSRAALKVLGELRNDKPFVFPGPFNRRTHMSNNCMLFATYALGYKGKATIHGMRGTFSTWAHEAGFNSDVIELALAHDDRDRVRSAYNSAQRLPERRALLTAWAEFVSKAEAESLLG